jgi:hypothetical protein
MVAVVFLARVFVPVVASFVCFLLHLPKADELVQSRYDRFDALLQLMLNGGRPWDDPPDKPDGGSSELHS